MWFTCQKIRLCTFVVSKIKRCVTKHLSIARFSDGNKNIFAEQNVHIKTCGSLYDKWRKEKKFQTVPNGSLNFKVNYVDTYKNHSNSQNSPVVVALHGAPGSHKDFNNLTLFLHQKGVRVVSPSFPDFTVYKPGIFRHSAEEKAEFVKDFLFAVSIKQIDALVVHSSAIYPGLLLCLSKYPNIKSIIMLNPGTYSLNMKTTKYMKLMEKCAKIAEVPIILKIFELISPIFFKIIKLPVRAENVYDPLLSATCMVHAGITESRKKFHQLAKSGFPILYMFSDNDKLIGKESSYELAHFLGASDSDVYIYDKDGNLIQNGKERRTLKIMSFECGSHYVLWRHSDIVLEAVADFITKLRPFI